jgi:hypothetical protein
MNTIVELGIFSPRWGHEDTYTVELAQDSMQISMQARRVTATWNDSTDPTWSGESIESIMNNDSIYPPAITQDLFERVWKAWRDGELNDQEAEQELQHIAEWLNVVTKAKPNSEFWRKYF